MASISPSHQRAPPCRCFGEQVASKDADAWIDLVQDDMEALGYAVGAVRFRLRASVLRTSGTGFIGWPDSSGERLDQRKRSPEFLGRMEHDARKAAVGNGVCAVGRLADLHGVGLDSRRKGFAAVGYRQAVDADSGAGAAGRRQWLQWNVYRVSSRSD